MDREALERLRFKLDARAAELRAAINAAGATTAPVAPDDAIGRLTRMDALQSQQMASALVQRNRDELARIERALARLARGEYGSCGRCAEDIALARLAAMPDAVPCRACADRTGR